MSLLVAFDYAAMAKDDVPACPVCGMENPSLPAEDRFGCAIGVSGCWQCGLSYLNPRLTAAGYDAFYQGPYRESIQKLDPLYTPTFFLSQQRSIGAQIGAWLKTQHIDLAHSRILDLGGSTGVTALAMGCDPGRTTIVDVADDELRYARQLGFFTVRARAEDARLVGRMDGALCVQTFDHLTDPLSVLRAIRAPWLYVDVVDHARHCRKRIGKPEFKVDHPLNWSERALRLALKQTGWYVRADHTRSNHFGVLCERG